VITAGTHLAPSIKVAEAAKVIENLQRDINIAFVNELAKIFQLLDIDTQAVLRLLLEPNGISFHSNSTRWWTLYWC
jgi:UDP-N-acetyl-D-mannosaminuronate dehydrogenase